MGAAAFRTFAGACRKAARQCADPYRCLIAIVSER